MVNTYRTSLIPVSSTISEEICSYSLQILGRMLWHITPMLVECEQMSCLTLLVSKGYCCQLVALKLAQKGTWFQLTIMCTYSA